MYNTFFGETMWITFVLLRKNRIVIQNELTAAGTAPDLHRVPFSVRDEPDTKNLAKVTRSGICTYICPKLITKTYQAHAIPHRTIIRFGHFRSPCTNNISTQLEFA